MTFCIASLPRPQHTNTLVVITTWLLRRFTLGLPKHSEAQKLNTYQSWEKNIHKNFFLATELAHILLYLQRYLVQQMENEKEGPFCQQFLLPHVRNVSYTWAPRDTVILDLTMGKL